VGLINATSIAANAISYGLTGKPLLANVVDGILKSTGSNLTYDQALAQAQQAIVRAGSASFPQSSSNPMIGGGPGSAVGGNPVSRTPNKDDLYRPTESPKRFNDDVVSRTEQRPPARR